MIILRPIFRRVADMFASQAKERKIGVLQKNRENSK